MEGTATITALYRNVYITGKDTEALINSRGTVKPVEGGIDYVYLFPES
jgi:hypothetical protein